MKRITAIIAAAIHACFFFFIIDVVMLYINEAYLILFYDLLFRQAIRRTTPARNGGLAVP